MIYMNCGKTLNALLNSRLHEDEVQGRNSEKVVWPRV